MFNGSYILREIYQTIYLEISLLSELTMIIFEEWTTSPYSKAFAMFIMCSGFSLR